ncbi:MOSC domain-containing protein [Spirosoma endophyticum]|uniref:MOSC domain-containing protein YiiM n=1 Tax=Spirosoma endophyticum TaxID=662367 RepID=A0A1I1RCF4_9BACT|nr:MOSC domain-containing protein [Spirosoma endophyticum]SFD31955.1 MOSC domain-containing protein YiiM [Spirosoma endophyticum]
MQNIKDLFDVFPQAGRVEWIGIRPERRESMEVVETIAVSEKKGILGDHYSGQSGNRHVTLIQAEHLPVVAALTGRDTLDPAVLRRNITISGLNLLALKDHEIQIGDVVLQITGLCHPCSKMETALGPGGYNAMRGHGGLTAKVVKGGIIQVGDAVVVSPTVIA